MLILSRVARRLRRPALLVLPLGAMALASGCNLDVLTPQVVPPASTEGAAALPTLLAGAVGDFSVAYGGFDDGNAGEGIVLNSGLMADEFISADYFASHQEIDKRSVTLSNGSNSGVLLHLMQALRSAQTAAASYVSNGQSNASGRARALSMAGYIYTLIAEDYCSGVPFSSIDASGRPIYGTSKSTTEMLDAAIAKFDSATTVATAANSSSQLSLARVGKGRALLDRGDFAPAAAAVSNVAVDFVFATEQGTVDVRTKNGVYVLTYTSSRYTVANGEGPISPLFVSAGDPRVETEDLGTSQFDGSTELFGPVKYSAYESPIVIASGIEARLIIAEASLRGGNYPAALAELNSIRAEAGLAPLDPAATPAAQQNQLFDERAFWLFGTAHRLGDLRRLVRQYGRAANSVFPSGPYFKGNVYGNQVAFLVPQEEEQDNPNYNRAACDPTKP